MAKKLTDIGIRNLKPAKARREVPDGGCVGLYLLLQPNGKKSWAVRYRLGGISKKFTIGSCPPISLAEARTQATAALLQVTQGIDPVAVSKHTKAEARKAAIATAGNTVERLFDLFFDQHCKVKTRKSSYDAVHGTFKRDVLPKWGGRMVADITRSDVKELIRGIAKDRPIKANRSLAHLSRFFKWCVSEDYIVGSPCVGIERPAKENVRERALNDDEVRTFWAACADLPAPSDCIYKLLLLSGARRQEIGDMQWRELDMVRKTWTLPAKRSKSKVAHLLPLGPLAWSIIEAQPRIVGSDYVFVSRRGRFSHMKRKLDAVMKTAEPWVNHDLRRTARSLMSRARIDADVAELMIGHLIRGVRRIYDRHSFLDEKRDGFQRLEREIDMIINPLAAKVVPFRG